MTERRPEVEIIEQRNSPLINMLATVGGGLIAVLLSWVAYTQTHLQTQMAVVIANQDSIVERATIRLLALENRVNVNEREQGRVWPRLRSLETNQQILSVELHDQHPGAKMSLTRPDN